MRADFCENCSIHKGKQPDEARRAVRRSNRSKWFAVAIRGDARQRQLRRALRQMCQGPALQINEGTFPRRMHHLEDERMSVCARQMEVVVVFARQRPRSSLQPVKFARQADRFRFRRWLSYAGLQQHATNLICKSRSASIPDGLTIPPPRPSTRNLCLLELLSRLLHGNRPIHSGKPDHRRCVPILDAAMLVVPGLAGTVANARLAADWRMV